MKSGKKTSCRCFAAGMENDPVCPQDLIRRAGPDDAALAAELASLVYETPAEELKPEFDELLRNDRAAVFLKYRGGVPVGFAQCQLRTDYVEGTESSPVGYLEGICVREEFRRQGCAAELLRHCEDWAREQGCFEFASDCPLENTESLRFHLGVGFKEANRIICFTKKL